MRKTNVWLPAAALILFHISLVLLPSLAVSQPEDVPWHFDKAPFINPKILDDLTCWISDHGDQVVEINLTESQESNRYSCQIRSRTADSAYPYVYYERENSDTNASFPNEFTYQYVGKTTNGIYVLRTWDQGGGSGQFEDLQLLTFEKDYGIDDSNESAQPRKKPRQLLKKLAEIGLGDRWYGSIEFKNNTLVIHQSRTQDTGEDDEVRTIDLSPFH